MINWLRTTEPQMCIHCFIMFSLPSLFHMLRAWIHHTGTCGLKGLTRDREKVSSDWINDWEQQSCMYCLMLIVCHICAHVTVVHPSGTKISNKLNQMFPATGWLIEDHRATYLHPLLHNVRTAQSVTYIQTLWHQTITSDHTLFGGELWMLRVIEVGRGQLQWSLWLLYQGKH